MIDVKAGVDFNEIYKTLDTETGVVDNNCRYLLSNIGFNTG